MEYKPYIEKMRQIQEKMIHFLDEEEHDSMFFQFNFYEGLNEEEEQKYRLKEILHLILQIANNHHHSSNFYKKIDSILNHFKEDIIKNFSSYELFNIFQTNKRVLLYLIKEQIIQFDSRYLKIFRQSDQDCFYFFPEISHVSNSSIENDTELFQLNRENGENESYICEIIRKDSIEEFKKFIEEHNLSLTDTKIKSTIFETNLFLIDKQPTLIEYSAFFGSIQIFKYLSQKVKVTSKIWLYAIHGNSKELINLLEQNHVKPGFLKSKELLIESIKCHHNDMTEYIQKKFYDKKIKQSTIIPYYNYKYIDIESTSRNMAEFISNDYIELFSNVVKHTDNNKLVKHQFKIPIQILIFLVVVFIFSTTRIQSLMPFPFYYFHFILNHLLSISRNISPGMIIFIIIIFVIIILIIIIFIKKKPLNNIRNKSLLTIAVSNSNIEIINILKSIPNVDVNEVIKVNKIKKTPLLIAIEKEDIETIKILLSIPNIDINEGIGPSILINALIFAFSPLFLIIYWILYRSLPIRKKTPLELAIEIGNTEIIKILLSHPKIKINQKLVEPIIVSALKGRNSEVIQIIFMKKESNDITIDQSKTKKIIKIIVTMIISPIIILITIPTIITAIPTILMAIPAILYII